MMRRAWLVAALAAPATPLTAPRKHTSRARPLRLSPAEVMYEAQREAMCAQAAAEGLVFEGRCGPLETKTLSYAKNKSKRGGKKAGFGTPAKAESQAAKDAGARWRELRKTGILKIEGACAPATAAGLRAYVVDGVDKARRAVRASPDPAAESMRRFHATSEQPTRSFFKPRLDDAACHAGLSELLGADSKLGDLFALACGGDDASFYDYNALRTEPGCARQPVHWDTPFQQVPPLFTAFVALQTVTADMGATLFLPGTHVMCDGRKEFDSSKAGTGRRDSMLGGANARYALLEPGDVTIFDMRLLHCGRPNLLLGGQTRYFLNFTFCNPRADTSDLGHVPCIRAGYERRMTLRDARAELGLPRPFAALGDGF